MPKRKREEPKTAAEALRLMAKYGRKADQARDEVQRFAQVAYDKHGPAVLGRFDGEITVDERGRVHIRDEFARWDNGVLFLRLIADMAEAEGWTGGDVAEHLDAMRTEGGVELAAAVRELGRELGEPARRYLPPSEVAAIIRQRAARIEAEAARADRGREAS